MGKRKKNIRKIQSSQSSPSIQNTHNFQVDWNSALPQPSSTSSPLALNVALAVDKLVSGVVTTLQQAKLPPFSLLDIATLNAVRDEAYARGAYNVHHPTPTDLAITTSVFSALHQAITFSRKYNLDVHSSVFRPVALSSLLLPNAIVHLICKWANSSAVHPFPQLVSDCLGTLGNLFSYLPLLSVPIMKPAHDIVLQFIDKKDRSQIDSLCCFLAKILVVQRQANVLDYEGWLKTLIVPLFDSNRLEAAESILTTFASIVQMTQADYQPNFDTFVMPLFTTLIQKAELSQRLRGSADDVHNATRTLLAFCHCLSPCNAKAVISKLTPIITWSLGIQLLPFLTSGEQYFQSAEMELRHAISYLTVPPGNCNIQSYERALLVLALLPDTIGIEHVLTDAAVTSDHQAGFNFEPLICTLARQMGLLSTHELDRLFQTRLPSALGPAMLRTACWNGVTHQCQWWCPLSVSIQTSAQAVVLLIRGGWIPRFACGAAIPRVVRAICSAAIAVENRGEIPTVCKVYLLKLIVELRLYVIDASSKMARTCLDTLTMTAVELCRRYGMTERQQPDPRVTQPIDDFLRDLCAHEISHELGEALLANYSGRFTSSGSGVANVKRQQML